MQEILVNIDWVSLMGTIWTVVLLPLLTYVGTEVHEWAKSKKIDKYTNILYEEVKKAVKSVQNAVVDDIKGGEGWDEESKEMVRELAKTKAKQGLSNAAIKCLQQVNDDFELYLDALVDTVLFDIKNK